MSYSLLEVEDLLTRTTVRLEAGNNQTPISTGTGFFYEVSCPETNIVKKLIMTNKHVIENSSELYFVLTTSNDLESLTEGKQPNLKTNTKFMVSLKDTVINHPDEDIDLCVIDITPEIDKILYTGKHLRAAFFNSTVTPSADSRKHFKDVEPVLVIGYPRGLWDDYNNMPIARLGSTATHPFSRYQGKSDFLVDAPIYSGSSGSPVFRYHQNVSVDHEKVLSIGSSATLLGIIWGGIEENSVGELVPINIPASLTEMGVKLKSSLNLGIAIHISEVIKLDKLVIERIKQENLPSS